MSITLRPIKPEDDEFLFAVYTNTREDEMRLYDGGDQRHTLYMSFRKGD